MSTLTVSPSSVQPGGKVTVSGRGFPARVRVLLTLGLQIVASTTSDVNGGIKTSFVVPNGQKSGAAIVRSVVASSGAAALTVTKPVPVLGNSFRYE